MDPKLNTNQIEVIKRILAPGDTSWPLVVFGPFGTGKTFTLNQAIRHLVTKKHNRILLCTHTNSAADIHVTLLHNYLTTEKGLNATKPIRIYQPDRRSVNLNVKLVCKSSRLQKVALSRSIHLKHTQNVLLKSRNLSRHCNLFPYRTRSPVLCPWKGTLFLN